MALIANNGHNAVHLAGAVTPPAQNAGPGAAATVMSTSPLVHREKRCATDLSRIDGGLNECSDWLST
jgi:hypothetical protein